MNHQPRILFFAEAVTLAHIARPLALISALDKTQYAVCVACASQYAGLVRSIGVEHLPLNSISGAEFLSRLASGSPLYSTQTLGKYVDDDLQTISRFRPDLVVGDFRISLAVSARVLGVPYVAVTNAYWSPHATPRFPVPEIPLTRLLGVRAGQFVFDIVRPLAFAYHSLPLNIVRRRHGLSTLGWGLRRIYTEADYTLYADLEELVPTKTDTSTTSSCRYIGPVLWSFPAPVPSWWDTLRQERPSVYVTLGSSGRIDLLPTVLRALGELPVNVIATTAGRAKIGSLPENVYTCDFLPGDKATSRSSLVISNGGSLTTYQALAMGVPVLGIAGNMDQLLNMSYVAATGAGTLLRAGQMTSQSLMDAVKHLLFDAEPTNAAKRQAKLIAGVSAPERFRDFLNELCHRRA